MYGCTVPRVRAGASAARGDRRAAQRRRTTEPHEVGRQTASRSYGRPKAERGTSESIPHSVHSRFEATTYNGRAAVNGEVAERSKVLAWKASVRLHRTAGSNPALSASLLCGSGPRGLRMTSRAALPTSRSNRCIERLPSPPAFFAAVAPGGLRMTSRAALPTSFSYRCTERLPSPPADVTTCRLGVRIVGRSKSCSDSPAAPRDSEECY